MGKLGFYYDPTRCTGCRTCQMACKEKNGLSAGEFCRRVDTVETEGKWMHFSLACNHCEDPACMAVCPTGAMYRGEDGTVQHRDNLCIGCARCVHACPYGAPFIGKYSGYAVKCNACADRRAEGKAPACVEACPMRALNFGDLDEITGGVQENCGASLPFLPSAAETRPHLAVRGAFSCEFPEEVKVEKGDPEDMEPTDDAVRIVILGSGIAAVAAAKEIRRRSKAAEVTMISRETRLPYARPMLSKGLTGSFSMDSYSVMDENWLAENAVTYLGGAEIVSLDTAAHTVSLADGRCVSYDKCIYALGADCFAPPIPGRELKGVFTLRYDSDLAAIRAAMLRGKRAVIVGGGITGLELAWELKKSGLEVTVLDVLARLMDRFLDGRTADLLREAVEAVGIEVRTGAQIRAIEGEERAERICFADGTAIEAQIVILSTGYRPNTALAKAAGIVSDRAVTVSERMETSNRDVFACGDCADRSSATWLQSIRQGTVAAANALGAAMSFAAEAEPVMVHTADTALLTVGDMGKREGETYSFLYGAVPGDDRSFFVNPAPRRYAAHVTLCLRGDTVVGAALLGSISLMRVAQYAVDEGWSSKRAAVEFTKRGVVFHEE